MTCPNCGHRLEGGRCPHCGYSSVRTSNRALAVVLAVFVALPCAAFGACSAWMEVGTAGTKGAESAALLMLAFVLASVAALVLIGYAVRNLWRK